MSIADAFLAVQLHRAVLLLERINRKIDALTAHEIRTDHQEEQAMATMNEALQGIADSVSGVEEDVQRVLAAFANAELTADQQVAVDALRARFDTINAQLDAAVPPAGSGEGDEAVNV